MIHVVENGILGSGVGGTELQLGHGLIPCAGLADTETAGSVGLQLGILLTVLRILDQILGTDIHFGDIGNAALFDLAARARRAGFLYGCGRGLGRITGNVHFGQNLLNNGFQIFLIHLI